MMARSRRSRSLVAAAAAVLAVAVLVTAAALVRPGAPSPVATLYGGAGTLRGMGAVLPTGESVATEPVAGWGFRPGQSAFFSTLSPSGEVLVGTNPQTDNQSFATADHMSIGVFDPARNTFRNLVIPTSTGALSATSPFQPVGGASVETLLPVTVGGRPRIAFISLLPYHGWNVAEKGLYPSLGYLDVTADGVRYNPELSRTADQIHARGGLSAEACPLRTNLFGQQVAHCRGLGEMDLLPLSRTLVMTQYFPDRAQGQHSGRIIVMDTDGTVLAQYVYPNIPDGRGGFLQVNPRGVAADPTARGDREHFTVVFDVTGGSPKPEFPIQEFAYERSSKRIIPVSRPVLTGQRNAAGERYRFETMRYDAAGNLWATQAVPGSLAGGPMVVYANVDGKRRLQTACPAGPGWDGEGWGSACPPDRTAPGTADYGQTRSLVQDPASGMMLAATFGGYLMRVQPSGGGADLRLTTLPPVSLGLGKLVDRRTHHVGVRTGVVDPKGRALYVPVVQTQPPAGCPTWPGPKACPPRPLDQWLYRFNLDILA